MKKLFTLVFSLIISNVAFPQHYGGLYFSPDWILSHKPLGTIKTGNYLKDYNFSMGYTFGYQGLLMEARRFSFAYGLQYNYRTTYQENFGAPYDCGNGVDFENYIPTQLDESWKSLEVPLSTRYNILKNRKLQPYVSMTFVVTYPMVYQATLTSYEGEVLKEYQDKFYEKRLDLLLEFGAGLNYKINKYIFSIEPHFRLLETKGNVGLALSALRKF